MLHPNNFNKGVPMAVPPTHVSPQDFSVAYTSASSVTVSGAPFVVDDSNCYVSYILYKPSGGTWQPPLLNGNFSLTAAANVISVTGTDGPFAAGDTYIVGLVHQQKGYSAPENAFDTNVINPVYNYLTSATVASVSSGADNTYSYYLDMDTYSRLGLQYVLDGGSGTVTVRLFGTAQDDGTAAASITSWVDITYDTFDVTNWTASAVAIDDAGLLALYKFLKIEVVAATGGADDASWTIYAKQMY